MPKTTMAPAGAATFIVPRIRLRDGSVGCTQIAGSSGSFASGTVPYSASISNALDNGDGAGGGLVESSSGSTEVCRQPAAHTKIAAAVAAPAAARIPTPATLLTGVLEVHPEHHLHLTRSSRSVSTI